MCGVKGMCGVSITDCNVKQYAVIWSIATMVVSDTLL